MARNRSLPYRRILLIVVLGATLANCTTISQRGNLSRASGRYAEEDYQGAISLADFAISQGETTPEIMSQAQFLKAKSLEALGQGSEAAGLYQFIVEKYPDTAAAYQAKGRLAMLGAPCPKSGPASP